MTPCTDVLPLFEALQPNDHRPYHAIEVGRAWIRGEVRMGDAHREAFQANAAARGVADWQWAHLPDAVRELVPDDQRRRTAIFWHVFD